MHAETKRTTLRFRGYFDLACSVLRRFPKVFVSRSGLAIGVCCLGLTALIAGCALVDSSLEPRGDMLNRTITDYRNNATLLNIIRASNHEPMNFVTLSTATGHGSIQGTEGLPSFILGPHTAVTNAAPAVPARNWVFGPNSVNESVQNDFNVAALDDPQSYMALMTPLDIGMIGFFFGRHWPMPLLLPIFVNYVRIISADGKHVYEFSTDSIEPTFIFCRPNQDPRRTSHFVCEKQPSHISDADGRDKLNQCLSHEAICFAPVMIVFDYLYREGLVVQVPAGAVPGTQTPARICFDSVYNNIHGANFDQFLQDTFGLTQSEFLKNMTSGAPGLLTVAAVSKQKSSRCESATWIMPQNLSQGGNATQPPTGKSTGSSPTPVTGAPARNVSQNYKPVYEFNDLKSGALIQIATRSTWDIYQYIGDLVEQRKMGVRPTLLNPGFNNDEEVFRVVEDGSTDCFASVWYSGVNYCVPKDAPNSKMILSLLHELANLYTRPNTQQQPNTGTVRITQ